VENNCIRCSFTVLAIIEQRGKASGYLDVCSIHLKCTDYPFYYEATIQMSMVIRSNGSFMTG